MAEKWLESAPLNSIVSSEKSEHSSVLQNGPQTSWHSVLEGASGSNSHSTGRRLLVLRF